MAHPSSTDNPSLSELIERVEILMTNPDKSDVVENVARAICRSYGARIAGPGQSIASRELGWKPDGEHLDRYVEKYWHNWTNEAAFALEAMPTILALREALKRHHDWHLNSGEVGLPDGSGGWIAMDNAAEYSDSSMCEQTTAALNLKPLCKTCGGKGMVVHDAEWEPYAVECPACRALSAYRGKT